MQNYFILSHYAILYYNANGLVNTFQRKFRREGPTSKSQEPIETITYMSPLNYNLSKAMPHLKLF